MAPHLLPTLRASLTPDLTAALSQAHGVSHTTLHSANEAWMALILGALAHRGMQDDGPQAVRQQLTGDTLLQAASATRAFHDTPHADALRTLEPLGLGWLTELVGSQRVARVTLALAAVSGLGAAAARSLAGVLSAVGWSALAHSLRPHLLGDTALLQAALRAQAPDLLRQLDARLTTAAGLGSPSALLASLDPKVAQRASQAAGVARPTPPTAAPGTGGAGGGSGRWWAGGLTGAVAVSVVAATQLATCDSHDRLADALPAPGAASASALASQASATEAQPGPAAPMTAKVFFETGQSTVGKEGLQRLATVRTWLAAAASRQVSITGYTDSSGDHELNQALAHARALAVRRALQDAGIGNERILMRPPESVTLGADMTAAQARRVEVVGR